MGRIGHQDLPPPQGGTKAKEATRDVGNAGGSDDVREATRCGYGPCKPDSLQACNRPSSLLMSACWFTFSLGFVVNGIVNISISTLERRYGLSSSQSVWIPVVYEVAAGISAVVGGYLATIFHNGTILTAGAYSAALGSLGMVLPHLLAGTYDLGLHKSPLCQTETNVTNCADESQSSYLYLFLFGQLFNGVGGGILYAVVVPYMDANIRTNSTPLYIGVVYSFAAIGPAIGMLCGGYLLTVYVDVGRVDADRIEIEPDDRRWVGAWWIGFVCGSVMFLAAALLMCCFPRELPTAALYRSERQSQTYKGKGDRETQEESFGHQGKDLKTALRLLLSNPVWMLTCLGGIFANGAVAAFGVFLPKLLQYQFALSAGAAGIVAGVILIPGAAGGCVVGGIIPRRMKLKVTGLLRQCLITSLLVCFTSFIYLIRCQVPQVAGVTVNYFNASQKLQTAELTHGCNDHCYCGTEIYSPICGVDDVEYFSPCFAGCKNRWKNHNDDWRFGNCSCIENSNPNIPDAENDVCGGECTRQLVLFAVLWVVQLVNTFSGHTAAHSVVVRIVPDKERSFAIGLQSFIVRYLGHVPAPILFGAIFDSSCLVWQEKCDGKGSCWMYDSSALSWNMSWVVLVTSGVNIACWSLCLLLYQPPGRHREPLQVGDGGTRPMSQSGTKSFLAEEVGGSSLGGGPCKEETRAKEPGGSTNPGLTNDEDAHTRM